MSKINSQIFVAVVEDNKDPKRIGRCKCRVLNVFDDIPTADLPWASPWKDLNGNQFIVPEVGKVVSVVFDDGNIYKPEYIFAEHYNKNLESKLASLTTAEAYTSMRAVMYDHKTQIFSNDEDGLMIDYKFNNINIKESSININLKDNFANLNLGASICDQRAILGDNFMRWFDKFLTTITLNGHLGNLMSPTVATPEMLSVYREYFELRDPKFLSAHVSIVDNEFVTAERRGGFAKSATTTNLYSDGQLGDGWKSTVKDNNLTSREGVNFGARDGLSTDTPSPTSGDLTVSPGQNGAANLNNGAKDPGPINASTNTDGIRILETMKAKNYVILTRPYEMNIVGIRRTYEGMAYSNTFNDSMYLIYKIDDSDKWEVKKYACSTMPGYYNAVEVLVPPSDNDSGGVRLRAYPSLNSGESYTGNTKSGRPIDVKLTSVMQSRGGMGILKPAQYIGVYQIGRWLEADAMMIRYSTTDPKVGQQQAYRDNKPGPIVKYTSEVQGFFGMLIHKGFPGGSQVSNWSEGCQIFSKQNDMDDFFRLCKIHKDKYGNVFNHTLIEERDIVPLPPPAPPVAATPSNADVAREAQETINQFLNSTGGTPSTTNQSTVNVTGSQSVASNPTTPPATP